MVIAPQSTLADTWILRKNVIAPPRIRSRPQIHAATKANSPAPSSCGDQQVDDAAQRVLTRAPFRPARDDPNVANHSTGHRPSIHNGSELPAVVAPATCARSTLYMLSRQVIALAYRNFFITCLGVALSVLIAWWWVRSPESAHGLYATHKHLDTHNDQLHNASSIVALCCPTAQDTGTVSDSLAKAKINIDNTRRATDSAVDKLGVTLQLSTKKPVGSKHGLSCSQAARFAKALNDTAKQAERVAKCYDTAHNHSRDAAQGLKDAIRNATGKRIGLHLERKAKHRSFLNHASEFLGLVDDEPSDSILNEYGRQQGTLSMLSDALKQGSSAVTGLQSQYTVWSDVATALTNASGLVQTKTYVVQNTGICISPDDYEDIVASLSNVVEQVKA